MLAAVLTYLRLESRWSQSALSNAQQKDERQPLQGQTKELLIGYKKKNLHQRVAKHRGRYPEKL